ncbi:MAG: hypothetical protein ACTHNW_01030 [Mucilaginibacter sp.]
MSKRIKTIFLVLAVALPFLFYCVIYYGPMIRNAPYRFSDFESFSIQYGTGDSLVNKYDSKTGNYQYLNDHDSLIKKHLPLNDDQLLYLHRKAAYWGFWNFPEREVNDSAKAKGIKAPRYIIQFNYKHKSKRVEYDASFDGDPKLKEANEAMKAEIEKVLNEAEDKQEQAQLNQKK